MYEGSHADFRISDFSVVEMLKNLNVQGGFTPATLLLPNAITPER